MNEKSLLKRILLINLFSLAILTKINIDLAYSQLIKLCVALLIVYIISRTFCELWFSLAEILYAFSIALLMINLLGLNSIKRWTNIFGLFVQFSEFAKITMILMLSKFLSTHQMNIINFFKAALIILIPALLIFKQPNLGTSVIFVATGFAMILIKGINRNALVAGCCATLGILPVIWSKMLPYQRARITGFLNPAADPQGSSYQTIQSIIAIGAGGILGSSALQNKLGFVPENHTDFLFSYFAENNGFLVTSILLLSILFAMLKLFETIKTINNPSQRFFCIGYLILWLTQSTMNIGMNIGLLPVTGVALPFFSYGGNALVAFFIGAGIIINFMKYNKKCAS